MAEPVPKGVALRKKSVAKKRKQSQIDKRECDRLFSLIIRKRDGRCVVCGHRGWLECSHAVRRGASSVRVSGLNAYAMCTKDHQTFEALNFDARVQFLIERQILTQTDADWLRTERARPCKTDWSAIRVQLTEHGRRMGVVGR